MPTKMMPSEDAVTAWARLMGAQHHCLAVAESKLKAAALPSLSWYDALLEVERAGFKGLRPFELEQEMLLPQYGLSRLLDRIVAAGLLERRPCPEDGRGQVLVMTSQGKRVRRRMWPVYGQAIEEALGAKLTSTEARQLAKLLGKLT